MLKKIILINTLPRLDYWKVTIEPSIGMPSGILSIGTLLKINGYDVILIDPMVDRNYFIHIKDNLDDCLFVGISAMTAGVASGLEISGYIKDINPDIPIVWGGIHPTLFPEETLKDPLVDIVVWGEGEATCLELAFALGAKKDLHSVRGLGFKSNEHISQTPHREFVDINTLPKINYNLININKYIYRDLSSMGHFGTLGSGVVKIFILNTGRGCPYRCTFCINTHPSQKYRTISSENFLKDIGRIVNQYEPDIIYFQDDLFFANKERVFRFFEEYKQKKYRFKWITLTRINYLCKDYLSVAYLKQIKDSCLWLGMGIESGSERVRRLLKKEISDKEIIDAVKLLAKYKIPTNYAFMVGLPFENKQEIYQTLSLIKRIKKIHLQSEFTYQVYRPYPGGELYEEAISAGYDPPKTLKEWASLQDVETGFVHIQHLPWIKNSPFINYLLYAVPHSTRVVKAKNIYRILVTLLIKQFFKLSLYVRIKFNLECFNVEIKLWSLTRKLRQNRIISESCKKNYNDLEYSGV